MGILQGPWCSQTTHDTHKHICDNIWLPQVGDMTMEPLPVEVHWASDGNLY
jgi:hypothetical protein